MRSHYLPSATARAARPWRRPVVAVVAMVLASACAPRSRPVGGEIGDQVAASLESGDQTFDHSAWSRLLAEGTRNGLVDYEYFEAHRAELDDYLGALAAAELVALSADHLQALLMNAYNAYTIESILEHPGIASIREIDGVWSDAAHAVGGFELTLDEIEHGLLRPYFKDPRVHFAVNCASMSCAPLPPWAFDGEEVDRQLEQWTEHVFSWDKYARVEGDKLWTTALLDWYGGDFTEPDAEPRADSLAAFIARYAPAPVRELIEQHDGDPPIEFFDYDWSLNRADT